ncbi:MAG: hypothetical protein MUO63_11715 [Desulfobulbaceae bacterium]|nr:hypothetical protein [Desulfobulbaceae bacterium]
MSPHFGLMDETKMSKVEALLLRYKLHWRGGVRRMRENKAASGLATLYDALLSAMRWYILTNLQQELGDNAEEKLENERFVFSLLRRAGILDGSFDLKFVVETVDRALMEEDVSSDQERFMTQLHHVLSRIGVLPFDEAELPPEDPSTF